MYICFWFVSNLKKPTLTVYSIIRRFFQFCVSVLLYSICSEDELTSWQMKNIPPRGSGPGGAGFGRASFSPSAPHVTRARPLLGKSSYPRGKLPSLLLASCRWRRCGGDEEREGGPLWLVPFQARPRWRGPPKGNKREWDRRAHILLFLNTGSRWTKGKLNYAAILKVIHWR